MDPENPDPTAKEPDLEDAFRKWEAQRDDLPPPGVSLDELPLTADELLLDHEVARRPEAIIARARSAAMKRLAFAVVLTVVGLITLFLNREDFGYFMLSEDDIVDYGDLRERWIDGERPGDGTYPELVHNSWVRFENGIMTEERESSTGTFFFFEPMLKAVIVTTRPLPEKSPRIAQMHAGFSDLVNTRWILVRDLTAGFSGQGRLVRADQAPRRYQGLIDAYKGYLRLGTRLPADQTLWLILDGAEPRGQAVYVGIYVVALLVMMLSIVFWLRARRRLKDLEDLLAAGAALDDAVA